MDTHFIKPNQDCSTRTYIFATASILLLAVLHAALASAYLNIELGKSELTLDTYINRFFLIYRITFVVFLFIYPLFVFFFVRPKKFSDYLVSGYRWHLFSKERLLFSYPVMVIIPLQYSIYTSYKVQIPNINAFWLDVPLYKLDRAIFFGNDPWLVIQQIIWDPNITRAIDTLYLTVWLLLLLIFVLFHALGRHSLKIRLRFFLSYIIVWGFLGNALATVLSSAGPCYFAQATGLSSPYVELMQYLYSVKEGGVALNAVQIQEMLWGYHVNGITKLGTGISAMPSLHIAVTALFALSLHKIRPILEKLLYIYLFIIWVGSIHLGWHYASDGLVSGVCVILIWYYTGRLADKIITMGTTKRSSTAANELMNSAVHNRQQQA